MCSRSLYCPVHFPAWSTDCCDISIIGNFSNFIFSKWDIWSYSCIGLMYWHPILMLGYVAWPLLGETNGSCVTHWLIPCDHSLPHMSRLVTASCQNHISAWVETNRVDRTWMSLVLQQTTACLNAPDACSVVCRQWKATQLSVFYTLVHHMATKAISSNPVSGLHEVRAIMMVTIQIIVLWNSGECAASIIRGQDRGSMFLQYIGICLLPTVSHPLDCNIITYATCATVAHVCSTAKRNLQLHMNGVGIILTC